MPDWLVCLTFDHDNASSMISRKLTSPTMISRGDFGIVAVPRILDLLRRQGIPSTWFIPGHTIESYPACARAVADAALKLLDVDLAGLDGMDRRYLDLIAVSFGGGPVGVETLAAALSEPRDAIEDIIEPYLIQLGFVQRTPRGRVLTPHAFRHLGLPEPRAARDQFGLFEATPDAD